MDRLVNKAHQEDAFQGSEGVIKLILISIGIIAAVVGGINLFK